MSTGFLNQFVNPLPVVAHLEPRCSLTSAKELRYNCHGNHSGFCSAQLSNQCRVGQRLAMRHTYWADLLVQEDGDVTPAESEAVAGTSEAVPEQVATTKPADSQESAPERASARKDRGKKSVKKLPRQRIVKVLSVGMEVNGRVKRVSDFGAFVDIGVGRDGLLHISELAPGRVRQVTDVVKEGDEVTVWIKQLDREKNRISLTMIPPGTKTLRDLAEGELVSGTVQRITNYGAFVDIGLERDAMLHVKEMGDGYVAKPEDVVQVGEEIEARIVGVDRRRGRIDLSLKGLRPASEQAEQDVDLEPMSFSDEEEDVPSVMELALRQAFDDDLPPPDRGRRRKGSKRRKQGRSSQQDIISRTLRYQEDR